MRYFRTKVAKFSEGLFLYGCPLLIVIGTLGNALTVLVLNVKKETRKSSTSLLLSVLAVVDTSVLLTGLLRQWIIRLKGIDIRDNPDSPAVCPIHLFLTYTTFSLSAWMVLLVTIERYISVVKPIKAKYLCTRRRMSVASAMTILGISALNGHILGGWRLEKTGSGKFACTMPERNYYKFFVEVQVWQHCLTYSVIPFMMIVFCNTAIIRRLHLAKLEFAGRSTRDDTKKDKSNSLTKMLLYVNLMFLLTTLPVSGLIIYQERRNFGYTEKDPPLIRILYPTFIYLSYVNNACNFFIYCFSGRKFRADLISLFACLCRS
ncbi:C-C chemokine receptor type 7-like [Tubulanus polymorphus]|uniref:C-C chemokine receptor type 7-like n=1 Tax=Tubulanus polymorphus TaxID=672921 RepID=UPI003DA4E912